MEYGYLQTQTCIGPQCTITVFNYANVDQQVSVSAIIDSGAARTCIPASELSRLGNLVRCSPIRMIDAYGDSRNREVYLVNIEIADYMFDDLEVIKIPDKKAPKENYALVGRDILNKNKVVLHGIEKEWKLNCNQNCE